MVTYLLVCVFSCTTMDIQDSNTSPENDGAEQSGEDSEDHSNDPESTGNTSDRLPEVSSDISEDIDVQLLEEKLEGDVREEVHTVFETALKLSDRVTQLEGKTASLESEIETVNSQLEKEREDFKSYKKQREEKFEEERRRYVKDVFTGVVSVHSELQRAVNAEHESVESIVEGIDLIRSELESELNENGVEILRPQEGELVDTEQHDVVTTVPSDEFAADEIVEVQTLGYMFEGELLSPAEVVISS